MKESELEEVWCMMDKRGSKDSFKMFCESVRNHTNIEVEEDEPLRRESNIIFLPGVHTSPAAILSKAMDHADEMSQLILIYRLDTDDDPLTIQELTAGLSERDYITMMEEAKFDGMATRIMNLQRRDE